MMTEKKECDYQAKKTYRMANMTICYVTPDKCPYKLSLRLTGNTCRCIGDGKVEEIVKQSSQELVLATQ